MADKRPSPSVARNTPFKKRQLDTPRFKGGVSSSPFKTPSAAAVPVNDDATERRIRKRENYIRSAVSPGCSTTRSVARNPDGTCNLNSATSSFSNTQIAEHYSVCVKLSTENKINAKNAFGLHLIDVMAEMLRKRGEMTNFQVAGCTLDASAKIYAGRVDSIYNDACKMVGGLGRSDRHGDDEEKEEGEEAESGLPQKKKIRKSATVIEKNLKSLGVSTFDLEFEVDPLFKKTSAAFDEGGVEGLLLNQLCVDSDHCSLLLDANRKLALLDRPAPSDLHSPITTTELTNCYRRLHNFQDSRICSTFSSFQFNEDNTTLDLPPISLDHCPPIPSTEVDYSYMDLGPPPPDDENYNNEDDSYVHAEQLPSQDSPHSATTSNREPLKQRQDNVIGVSADTIQVSEYSYFDPTVISAWAGPQHWKFKPHNAMKPGNKEGEQRQTKKRQPRVAFRVDLTATFKEDLFRKGRASTVMSKLLLERMTSVQNVLPHCSKTDESVLYHLFCNTKVKIKRSERLDNACELSDAGDVYGDADDDANNYAQSYQDDDDDHSPLDEYDEARVSGFQFMNMLSETDNINLIDEPRKVCHVDIEYAKQAKRIDVKKVKGIMYNMISRESTQDSSISFGLLFSYVKTQAPVSMASELSIPISFVCLLYLTNEKSLKVTGQDDMLDLAIFT